RGTALCTASRTSRRCTPNFRATPWIVPRPNSYSRRICSNSSTVAFLRRISPLPTVHLVPRAYAAAAQGGPFPTIELGQTRVSKTTGLAGGVLTHDQRLGAPQSGAAAEGPPGRYLPGRTRADRGSRARAPPPGTCPADATDGLV